MSMANTMVNELRLSSPDIDKWTNRPSRYGNLDVYMKQTADTANGIITPDMQREFSVSTGRTTKVPVFDAETVTISSSRSVTISDSENTSQLMTLTKTVYDFGFTVAPTIYKNNEIGYAKDFNRKFTKYLYKLADVMDVACEANLDTNKTQVFNDSLSYTPASNVVPIPLADRDRGLGDLGVIHKSNDYFGMPLDVVGNAGVEAQVMQQSEHGLYNDQNKQIALNDKHFHFSNNISNGAGHDATGYILSPGSVGIMFAHEIEALYETTLPDGTQWSKINVPLINIPMSTYFYYGVADKTALGAHAAGMDRVAVHHFGYSVEVTYVFSYINDLTTIASPCLKFAFADA